MYTYSRAYSQSAGSFFTKKSIPQLLRYTLPEKAFIRILNKFKLGYIIILSSGVITGAITIAGI